MTQVLEAKAPGSTHAIGRDWVDTETVKPCQDRGQDNSPPSVKRVHFGSRSNVDTIVWGKKGEFTVPASYDQDKVVVQALGTYLSSRLRQVLPFIASCEALAGTPLNDVIKSLSEPGISVPHQPENRNDQFRSKLIATLLDESIEDGVTHPAEGLIDEALRADSSDCQNGLSRVLVENYSTRPSLCASIIRCIGRLDDVRVRGWGMRVVDDALQNRDAEVREAAIRALEAWGGSEALDMLRRHKDTEVWLDEYVQQVIVDLSGTTA
ncbi:MAG: HEAT repeat domain-containing protein [Planctomycetes bacterium]|nr:HEAT repeat domain-containing protein [Planctomycetota bacterium]